MNVKNLSKALLVTAIFFSAGVAQAWTEPTVAAPNGNVTVPLRLDANGRLGIGTTNALYTLDVSGSIRSTTNIISSTFQTNTGDLNISGSGWGMIFNVDVDANSINNYIFRGDNVEIMRLTDTGNLGIGVASPATKLQVDGDVRSNTGIFSNLEANDYIQINPTDDSFRFFSNSNEMLSILANGNTGVGVAAPAYRLDVAGDVNVPTGRCYRVNGVCIGSSAFSGSGTVNYVPKFTAASTVGNSQIFDNATNVGVGTAAPTQKLSVNGNINKLGSWILGDANWLAGALEVHNASWDGVSNNNYGTIAAGKVYAYRGLQSAGGTGAEAGDGQLYVHDRSFLMGNVGVGLMNPTSKLEVSGDLKVNNPGVSNGEVVIGGANRPVVANFTSTVSGTNAPAAIYGSYTPAYSGFGQNGSGVHGYARDTLAVSTVYGVLGQADNTNGWGIYCGATGGARCGGTTGWTNLSSDIRIKEKVEVITNALDKLKKVRGVTWEYKNDPTNKRYAGYIANEFHEVLPEVTGINPDTGYFTINEGQVGSLIIEAVKELNTKVDRLEAENNDLRARLERLEAKVQ